MFGFGTKSQTQPVKTLDEILAGFQQTVTDLRDLSADRHSKADDDLAHIKLLEGRIASCRKEATRASEVATKLETLIK